MTPIAIVFFVVAAVVIWGGLAASVIYLVRHNASPLEDASDDSAVEDEPPSA